MLQRTKANKKKIENEIISKIYKNVNPLQRKERKTPTVKDYFNNFSFK